MATTGFLGFYVETRNYGATAAFWASLGFENVFDTDHGSGQWIHPTGGPYVFIAENGDLDAPLVTHPILAVADATAFRPSRPPEFLRESSRSTGASSRRCCGTPTGVRSACKRRSPRV